MNIVGKILVILNLVFAVAVGGFIIVHTATSTNWRREYEAAKKELDIARRSYDTMAETTGKDVALVRKYQGERDNARREIVKLQEDLADLEAARKAQVAEHDRQATQANLRSQELLTEATRLREEVKAQLDIIKQRDDVIVKERADVVKFRNAAVAEENSRKALEDRLQQMLARVNELTGALQKATTGQTSDTAVKGKANPPATYLEGKIDQIAREDPNLVQLSVGSDKGLARNHTLEVYRIDPPGYLGLVRIVDVQPHTAIGRREKASGGPLRVGDTVASTLSR
jgi:hypothetical protein